MISVQSADFDVNECLQLLRNSTTSVGAVSLFIGVMRDLNLGDKVSGMWLEHYPGMTEKTLLDIENQARARWSLQNVVIIHRVGHFKPSDQIVLVATCSEHREDAISATAFIMDYLKTRSPFWKKEQTDNGTRWVEQRDKDFKVKQWT